MRYEHAAHRPNPERDKLQRGRPGLSTLFESTQRLLNDPRSITRALHWVDATLPLFADACRQSLYEEPDEVFTLWQHWIESPAFDVIAEAGKEPLFSWRRRWLRLLLEIALEVKRIGPDESDSVMNALAEVLVHKNLPLPECFPTAFWYGLLRLFQHRAYGDHLGKGWDSASEEPTQAVTFPLILSEPILNGGSETRTLLAEFTFERQHRTAGGVFLAPDQAVLRCMDAAFTATFAQATLLAQRIVGRGNEDLPDVAVRLRTVNPSQERFLTGTVLQGTSGAGALTVGLVAFYQGLSPRQGSHAISFAIAPTRNAPPDGRCYPVGGGDDKIRGCAKQGMEHLLVAREQESHLAAFAFRHELDLVGVTTVQEAIAFLYEQRAPALLLREGGGEPSPVTDVTTTKPIPPLSNDDFEPFDGVVPLSSRFYVVRAVDPDFLAAMEQNHSVLLVKGPRQVGKSSLLARGVARAQRIGHTVVVTDFQKLSSVDLSSLQSLYCALARMLARQLNVKVALEDTWNARRSPNLNFEEYMEDHILPGNSPLLWAMDEADRLFLGCNFSNDVFGLFRSWANERQGRRTSPWAGVTLVIIYATEAHLFIKDMNQSPFNIGTRFELEDFTLAQVEVLNERYGAPLRNSGELSRFFQLLGGHPYLVRRGLHSLIREKIDINTFEAVAIRDDGTLGDHLRRLLLLLARHPHNRDAIVEVLHGRPCPSADTFFHLRSAGVLVGTRPDACQFRCQLYQEYLRDHLPLT